MKKVGITGGIGSGKTTVCQMFELLGVPVFNTDNVSKKLMVTDIELMEKVVETFGPETYFPDGTFNKQHVSDIVFNDKKMWHKMNEIAGPVLVKALLQWCETLPSDTVYCLIESAILFESGFYKRCDETILVIASPEIQMQRVMERDGFSKKAVQERMDAQWSDSEKSKLTENYINNAHWVKSQLEFEVIQMDEKLKNKFAN